MKRYETTPIKTDKSGIRVYSTTYYPDIPLDDSDEFILVDKSVDANELGQILEGGQPTKVTVKKIKEYLTFTTL